MNAPALNPAAAAPATASVGSAGAANASGQASGPQAGFEALLSALFPQGAVAGASQAAGTPNKQVADDAPETTLKDPAVDGLAVDAESLLSDANAALLASTLAGQALIAANATSTQPAEIGAVPGRDKSGGASTLPLPFTGELKANPETAADPTDAPLVGADLDTKTPPTVPPSHSEAPQGPRPSGLQPATASQVPGSAASTPVASTVDAGSSDLPPTPTVAPTTTTTPPSAAGLVARPEPPPAPPIRTARTDRNRPTSEVRSGDEATPSPAGGALTTAVTTKAVSAVAQTADASPKIAEAATRDADVANDAPDAALQAETRAAAQSLTPAALTAHGVRGSPETVATLAAQIIKKLEGQSTRFDLELNPAGLGKVDVRIDIGAHGRVSAAMMFDNPQAAADLRARATELQRMLEQAGFDMSGGLSFDVAGDRGQQQRQTWHNQDDNSGQAFRGQAFRAALDTAGNATDAAIEGALRLRRGINAGLDLRI